ncbi:MAG TPA: CopD family protein [Longimicrobium sp.]|nr:CopD family protein [Longimicrobium sp.]
MQGATLIEWPGPILELIEFLGAFMASGAVGFRYTALRRLPDVGDPRSARAIATRRAAVIGIIGALVNLWHLWEVLPRAAAREHLAIGELLTRYNTSSIWALMSALMILGFGLVLARIDLGWALAAVGVVVGGLRNALVGNFERLVTPTHLLAAGLWIGTLFVLVVAGIAVVMRHEPAGRRGARVADMVNAFSPLALAMGGLVVLMGVIAAWRELGGDLTLLWTTPYGYALLTKLFFVAVVFGLGAWNWRRQRPTLGSETAAGSIRRSARGELIAALLVLVATSIMLNLPNPAEREGGPPPGAPAAPPPAGAPAVGAR